MKTMYLAILVLFLGNVPSFAASIETNVAASSFTATNDTTLRLSGTAPASLFIGVVVSSKSTGGVLTVFDGQGANASNKIAVVDMGTIQDPKFNVSVSSGITYTTSGNSNGVTILFRR